MAEKNKVHILCSTCFSCKSCSFFR